MLDPAQPIVMTAEQADFLAHFLMHCIRREFPTTCRVLKAVPEGEEKYRPHENSRSALELAWHIACVDIWFLDGFLAGKFEMEDDSMPDEVASVNDILAWYEEEFPTKLEKVSALPASFWVAPLPFFSKYNFPSAVYLEFLLAHSVHHRGQLAAYLRSMGGKVPNIYGGSFDEPMAFPE
jgi:uncharacterized damage-inducible protein DinB